MLEALADHCIETINRIFGAPPGALKFTLHIRATSRAHAREQIAKLQLAQRELRLLKQEVSVAQNEARAIYSAERGTVTEGFLASLTGPRAAASDRAWKRRQIGQSERQVMTHLANAKNHLDGIILTLQKVKVELKLYIASPESGPPPSVQVLVTQG